MNHDRLERRWRSSASRSELFASMAKSCTPGSTGSPVASSLGGKTLHHRRAISSSDHCSAMSGRLRSTRWRWLLITE